MDSQKPVLKNLFSLPPHSLFRDENMVAWSVVPYDSLNRAPEERVNMLTRLGFSRFAFDWREEHLSLLPKEIGLLHKNRISLDAVWCWVDERSSNGLLPEHEQLFRILEEAKQPTTIWIGVHYNFYEGLEDSQKVEKVASVLKAIHKGASRSNSRIALYTHFGWLALPENQVRVIEATGHDDIGIVFSFHHAQDVLDRFDEALHIMKPYLQTVHLSGVTRGVSEIIDIGKGTLEKTMIRSVIESGFKGTIGIIGHTEGEDVEQVLLRNIRGLSTLLKNL
ncbi:hypothetical protein QLX67_03760 [Balneolaceae bacterium ANBcel3]|nr:hypothetical protein [Balneolaceae bacterium ANBcel3]